MVIDLNAEKADKLTEEIKDAALDLLLGGDSDLRTQAYNTILEKADALRETLLRVRYLKEREEGNELRRNVSQLR